MVLPVVRPLMHGQQKMFLSILEHLRVNTNGNAIHDINSSSVTCDLAVSGMFAALIIATLFCWHTQNRSDIAFITMTWGMIKLTPD